MSNPNARDGLVAVPIHDPTVPDRRAVVALVDIERPSGSRVFVRVSVEGTSNGSHINLEPEQARRLADTLEHGADLADREPVGIVRALAEQLAYYFGDGGTPPKALELARAWLKRHDPQ